MSVRGSRWPREYWIGRIKRVKARLVQNAQPRGEAETRKRNFSLSLSMYLARIRNREHCMIMWGAEILRR